MKLQKDNTIEWQKLKIKAQQKEIEQLKEDKLFYSYHWERSEKENTKLKEDVAIYKGVSEGKDIIIKQLERVNQQLTDKIIELNG